MENNRADIDNINKETLVDLFSTATYGSDWLDITTLIAEKELDRDLARNTLLIVEILTNSHPSQELSM